MRRRNAGRTPDGRPALVHDPRHAGGPGRLRLGQSMLVVSAGWRHGMTAIHRSTCPDSLLWPSPLGTGLVARRLLDWSSADGLRLSPDSPSRGLPCRPGEHRRWRRSRAIPRMMQIRLRSGRILWIASSRCRLTVLAAGERNARSAVTARSRGGGQTAHWPRVGYRANDDSRSGSLSGSGTSPC